LNSQQVNGFDYRLGVALVFFIVTSFFFRNLKPFGIGFAYNWFLNFVILTSETIQYETLSSIGLRSKLMSRFRWCARPGVKPAETESRKQNGAKSR
jgi:hypothetical protein